MGKSRRRRKRGGVNQVNPGNNSNSASANAIDGVDLHASVFLQRAHQLKEKGNKKFQNKDHEGASDQYNTGTYKKMARSVKNARADNIVYNKNQKPKARLNPGNDNSSNGDNKADQSSSSVVPVQTCGIVERKAVRWRQLKLVYDHDIRLSQMPVNCRFKLLREIVSDRFPSSKSVLIKYKDSDGDLVTITSTAELRLAESVADGVLTKEPKIENSDSVGLLRLHVVEVNPEQEPLFPEEEEEESGYQILPSCSVSHNENGMEINANKLDKKVEEDKVESSEDPETKVLEVDDWLYEFAQLFRRQVGIEPETFLDFNEVGMELCTEFLEETVTSKAAQTLFDKASKKFQEVAALAFFNWGNVHMCAARKRINPQDDESAGEDFLKPKIHVDYEWVKKKYALAREKYESALEIKPDFFESLLALGQQQFETAKLHWSYALAKRFDLSDWESSECLKLFDSAEEKMKAATKMWEKLEKQRMYELKKQGDENEAVEQAVGMRSQIQLFWGNMLFDRSQVECKIGMSGWKKSLDDAVEKFKFAGASEADVSLLLKNHYSNENAAEGDASNGSKS